MVLQFLCEVTLHVSAYVAIFRCVTYKVIEQHSATGCYNIILFFLMSVLSTCTARLGNCAKVLNPLQKDFTHSLSVLDTLTPLALLFPAALPLLQNHISVPVNISSC
jgi:hypothetical protein